MTLPKKKKQGLIQVCKNFKKQVCTCDMYFITFFIYVLGHTYTINLKSFSELKDMEVSNWFWQKWPSFPFFVACKHYNYHDHNKVVVIITSALTMLPHF